jgi:hypothetical protein
MTKQHESHEAHAAGIPVIPHTSTLAQRLREAIEKNGNSATQIAAVIEILNAEPESPKPAEQDVLTSAEEHHGRRRHV